MSALGSYFSARARDLRIWQTLTVLSLAAIPVTNQMTARTCMQEERFFAMDGQNYYYLSRVGTFQEAKRIHQGAAEDAVNAMFNRSPGMFDQNNQGFDLPAAIDRMFDKPTAQRLRDEAAKDADAFRQQQIYQWPVIGKTEEEWVTDKAVNFTVDVQVVTVRTTSGRVVPGSKNARVYLTMGKNTNMVTNGHSPLVVIGFDVKYL